jgi:transposase
MNKATKFIGMDISKNVFDVSFPDGKHLQFKNDVQGYQLFEKSLVDNDHCVMEATGSYHLAWQRGLLSEIILSL